MRRRSTGRATTPSARRRWPPPSVTTVIAVSIDGLNPAAIRALGTEGTPTLHRLIEGGASTLNARTEREQTDTLPNHTGMVTGRWIAAATGGHGVTWNDDRMRPPTVQQGRGATGRFGVQRRPPRPVEHRRVRQQAEVLAVRAVLAPSRRPVDHPPRQHAAGPGRCAGTLPTTPGPSGSCTCPHPMSPATRTGSCRRRTSTPSARPIGCWARSSRRSRPTTAWPGTPS